MTAPLTCSFADQRHDISRTCEHDVVLESGGTCAMRHHTVEDTLAAEDVARAEARAAEWWA